MSMATSNNDRVSSARLLDMIKGLQESRHLGSEPEVVTETLVEYPAVVSPAPGTYANESELAGAVTVPIDDRLPFRVYHTQGEVTYPITIAEPSGEYSEITKAVTIDGAEVYVEEQFDDISTYTGYVILYDGNAWVGVMITNGLADENHIHVWEMPEKTVTTTTKTKHPIKQDYVPNADWNQNDPDGEGYVEGRTHWVEVGEIEIPANQIASVFKPTGFKIETDGVTMEYNPSYEAVSIDYQGAPGYLLAENQNGEQETQFAGIFYKGIIILDGTSLGEGIVAMLVLDGSIVNNNGLRNTVVYGVGESVHKLDRKYYDYVDGDALIERVDDAISSIKSNETVKGTQYLPVLNYYAHALSTTSGDPRVDPLIKKYELKLSNYYNETGGANSYWLYCKENKTFSEAIDSGVYILVTSEGTIIGSNIEFSSPGGCKVEITKAIPQNWGTTFADELITNCASSLVYWETPTSYNVTWLSSIAGNPIPSDLVNFIGFTVKPDSQYFFNEYPYSRFVRENNTIVAYHTFAGTRQHELYRYSESSNKGNFSWRIDGRTGLCTRYQYNLRPFKLTEVNETIELQNMYGWIPDDIDFYYYYEAAAEFGTKVKRGVGHTETVKTDTYSGYVRLNFNNTDTNVKVWIEPIPCLPSSCYNGDSGFLNDFFLTIPPYQK